MKKNFLCVAVLIITAFTVTKSFGQTETLPNSITADKQLFAGITYIISGKVVVRSGATLFIEEGTVLKARKILPNTAASALIISRGARIEATGTNTSPIVFTSNEAKPASGDWGGIVILGRAPNNRNFNPFIEGIDSSNLPSNADFRYGPTPATPGSGNANESSGILNYVRIEYAGAAVSPNNELNGLTCGSVGRGTILDFIEVLNGADDAFEFFGGTVNAKHLIALAPDDDAFDFDFGYRGNLQYCISVLSPTKPTYSSDPNGIESDNDAAGTEAAPRTRPTISNMTVIGLEDSARASEFLPAPGSKRILNGARFRRSTSLNVRNSIFMGYPTGVRFESPLTQADAGNFQYNIVQAFRTVNKDANINGTNTKILGEVFFSNETVDLTDPFNSTSPDFRPSLASPASSGANFSGFTGTPATFFQTTTYRGAFSLTTNWANTWSRFFQQ